MLRKKYYGFEITGQLDIFVAPAYIRKLAGDLTMPPEVSGIH